MRRRSVLTAGAAGAAALLAGGGSAKAVTRQQLATLRAADADAVSWETASLRDLAARTGLRFGSALGPKDMQTPSYAAIAGSQFSSATPENAMKWEVVEPRRGVYDWSQADQLMSFAKAHGQLVRGHTLCWHNQIPGWVTSGVANGSITSAQLRGLLRDFITAEVSRYRGKIWQWDVCNEFFTDNTPSMLNPADWWIVHAGRDIIPEAFRWAHAADPNALLFYNDYNILGEDWTNAKSDAVYAYVKQLKADGVPIHGVGDQGHLDTQYGWQPDLFRQDMERFASLGLLVAVTEADVRTFVNNPTEQVPTNSLAQYAQPYMHSEMLKAALAVPHCVSFTVWGFGDANSWVPVAFPGEGYALMYDVHLQPKAAFHSLQSDLALGAYSAPQRVHTYMPPA